MMLNYYSSWVMLGLGILALVGILLAFFIILSYRSEWRSLDIYLISTLLAYVLDLALLILTPFLLSHDVTEWTRQICSFYAWCWLTLRFAHLLTLLVLSFDRIAIFRFSGYKFHGSRDKGLTVATLWIFSCVIGALPLVGDQWIGMTIFTSTPTCAFILYEINIGFGIFIIVTIIAVSICSISNMADALYNMATFKTSAYYCLNEGRFTTMSTISRSTIHRRLKTMEKSSGTIPGDRRSVRSLDTSTLTPQAVMPTALGLETAHDNCRIALIIATVSFAINHIPFAILSLYGVIARDSSPVIREVALWLILLDTLVVPHLLWMFNERYRNGAYFVCDVIRCRRSPFKKAVCENPVKLQSFVNTTELNRSKLESLRLNTLEDIKRLSYGDSAVLITLKKHQESLARCGYISDVDSARTCTPDGTCRSASPPSDANAADVASLSDVNIAIINDPDEMNTNENNAVVAVNPKDTPTRAKSSRELWKERMRKQHLPAQYVDELMERNNQRHQNSSNNDLPDFGTNPSADDIAMDTLVIHRSDDPVDPVLEQAKLAWRRSDKNQTANRGSLRSSVGSQNNVQDFADGETGSLSSVTLLTVPGVIRGSRSPSTLSVSNFSDDEPYSSYSTCSNRGFTHSRSSNPRSDDYFSLASDITPTNLSYLSDPEALACISYVSDSRDEITSTSSNAEYLSALDTSSSNDSSPVLIGISNIYF